MAVVRDTRLRRLFNKVTFYVHSSIPYTFTYISQLANGSNPVASLSQSHQRRMGARSSTGWLTSWRRRRHPRAISLMDDRLYVIHTICNCTDYFQDDELVSMIIAWPTHTCMSSPCMAVSGPGHQLARALFRCEMFLDFATVALSFVCGKYYSIMD